MPQTVAERHTWTCLPLAVVGALVVGTGLLVMVGLGNSAGAASEKRIMPTPDRGGEELRAARKLARAIVTNRRWILGASFSSIPPFGDPAAISTRRLTRFPRHGRSFAILTTGDATLADDLNLSQATGIENGGPSIRGSRDVTIFRITIQVPRKASCLSVRFRLLSEEFPEFVNTIYNDAFIAELDVSNWNTVSKDNPRIVAPRNFAADANGNPISVNAVGDASFASFFRAEGTTYDGATRLLRASTRISAGRHIVYMSIFDQGDRGYDSAVFIDRLTLNRRKPCESGAIKD
jgi:hypothetical protein